MKKLTRLLSLASIMMPMTLSAQDAYTWDFESEGQFNEWTNVDHDGDGYSWTYFNNEGLSTERMTPHGGEGLVFSASYDNDNGKALTPDNWLISPEVTLDGVLSLWARGQDPRYCEEVFGIFVCVGNSTDPDNFVQVGSYITATGEMTKYSFDLSTYAGQTGRFAIRHYQTTDMFILNIDDVCLNPNEIYIPDPTLPTNITVTPAATTATVTWDGADGDSWNIRYKEYNPNEFLCDLTNDNFVSQLEGWEEEDRDVDGKNWELTDATGYDPTGQTAGDNNVCFYSYSYNNGEAFDPDNWLYTPELTLGGTFKFYAMNEMADYPDVLGVYVVTEDGEYQIGEDFAPSAEDWTEYTFDTRAYNGKVGKIAIVHHNCHDQYWVYVDYISYEPAGYVQIEIDALTEPSFTIPGLKPGTEYVVEVQAYNEMGETKWIPITHFTTTNNTIATGLNQVTSDKSQVTSEEWYTLDGRKLNGKPAAKGIYIQNGQKQIIK